MKAEELLNLLEAGKIAEAAGVLACGILAAWIYRIARSRLLGTLEIEKVAGWTFLARRLIVSLTFPIAWVALVGGAQAVFFRFMPAQGVFEVAVPSIGFLLLFQVLSFAVVSLLPQARFTAWMIRLAIGLGLVFLALRLFGWAQEAMAWINFPFLVLGPATISVEVILKSVFLVWLLFLAAGQITAFLQNRVLIRTDLDPSLSFAMMRFLKFFLFGIVVLVVLDTAGINLSTLTIFGGALGIGLGFGLQNIANNLVSGMILLLDRSIKQGDVVSVGDSYGWVVRLGARYIVVRTRDGVEKLIPNANLIASEITNWSHSDRKVRLHVKVGVSYDSDPFKVRQILLRVADTNPRVLKSPQPNVLFVDFGESSLDFELRVWIHDPEAGIESVRSALRFEIWKAFQDSGVQIPYPQRDIHIRSEMGLLQAPEAESPRVEEPLPHSRNPMD